MCERCVFKGADKYGGSDKKDWWKYTKKDTTPSYDKGSHKERSIANQPNHISFWKKKWQKDQGSENGM